MHIQSQEITVKSYLCPICGEAYPTKKAAEQCARLSDQAPLLTLSQDLATLRPGDMINIDNSNNSKTTIYRFINWKIVSPTFLRQLSYPNSTELKIHDPVAIVAEIDLGNCFVFLGVVPGKSIQPVFKSTASIQYLDTSKFKTQIPLSEDLVLDEIIQNKETTRQLKDLGIYTNNAFIAGKQQALVGRIVQRIMPCPAKTTSEVMDDSLRYLMDAYYHAQAQNEFLTIDQDKLHQITEKSLAKQQDNQETDPNISRFEINDQPPKE